MSKESEFYLVEKNALPKVFIKVQEVKTALETGKAKSVGEAVKQVGISRSAFYKYRDVIRPFNDMAVGKIMTFFAVLKDAPGVLSDILGVFASCGANILTINQNIPTAGKATCTIVAATIHMHVTVEELMKRSADCTGVIRFETVAG